MILGVVAIVLAVEVALGWDQLAKAWMSLYEANWWWLLASVAGGGRVDAQLCSDPAHAAEVGRRARQAVALRSRLLCRQFAEHHAARRARAVGDVSVPPATASGAPRQWWRRGSW